MTLAKRRKTRKRSPKRKTLKRQPKALASMPSLSVVPLGAYQSSGTYVSTISGKTQKMDWDTRVNSTRDGAAVNFELNKDGSKLSGDLNASFKNHLASVKGKLTKNGKVHQVDLKDVNMMDQLSMQHAGLELAMLAR